MAIAGTNIPLNSTEGEDKITITEKVTTTFQSLSLDPESPNQL